MDKTNSPVNVDISIELLSTEKEAFYNLCFIAEHNTAIRTVEVFSLRELLDAGYTRESLAYNFCVSVFAQESMPSVIIRAKRTGESYADAYAADSNDGYYFISIQSKNLSVVTEFNSYLVGTGDLKLQFFSSPDSPMVDSKIVQYYQTKIKSSDVSFNGSVQKRHYYINKAFDLGYVVDGEMLLEDYQVARAAYPEAAWISFCGQRFPSKVQWLYKYLSKVDIVKNPKLPELLSTTSKILNDKSTMGSGTTSQGVIIHEQVSLDWCRWAIARQVWKTLYKSDKVPSTKSGGDIIVNNVKFVLDIAVEESIFSDYKIGKVEIFPSSNNISVEFSASLVYTILNCDISGSLYY